MMVLQKSLQSYLNLFNSGLDFGSEGRNAGFSRKTRQRGHFKKQRERLRKGKSV